MRNSSVFPNGKGTERIFSGVPGLKYARIISRVLSLREGATHTRWLVITISSAALHAGEAQEPGEYFCLPFTLCDETAPSFFFFFPFAVSRTSGVRGVD